MPAAHPDHLSAAGSARVPGGMRCRCSEVQTSVTKASWPNKIISTGGAGKSRVQRTGRLYPSHGPVLLPVLSVARQDAQPWDKETTCAQSTQRENCSKGSG